MRANFIQKIIPFFKSKPTLEEKRKASLERRIRNLLSLESLPANLTDTIKANRKKYGITPEIVRKHIVYGEKLPVSKSDLRPHSLQCDCILCRWTDTLRSLKAERNRLERIYDNIDNYAELKTVFGFRKHSDMFRNFNFSDYYKNNLPIYFDENNLKFSKPLFIKVSNDSAYQPTIPKIIKKSSKGSKPEQVTTEVILKSLGSRSLEIYGPYAHRISNNLIFINKEIEKLEKRIKKFKILIHL